MTAQPSPGPLGPLSQDEALAAISRLSPEQRQRLEEQITADPSKALWAPSPGPQSLAYHSDAQELFYGGSAGGGKFGAVAGGDNLTKLGYHISSSQPEEERFMQDVHHVQTPFGPKLIDDISVGDSVLNPDGTTCEVIAATPVHKRPSYRVHFNDGTSVVVGDRHLWPIKLAGKRPRRKETANDGFDLNKIPSGPARFNAALMRQYRIVTTETLQQYVAAATLALGEDKRPFHPLVPLTEPVNTQTPYGRTSMMPAYTLGVLLGDGSISTDGTPSWVKPSNEVAACVVKDLRSNPDWTSDNVVPRADGKTWGLIGGDTLRSLKSLGLIGCRAWEKFIPTQYLRGPLGLRRDLMQGMMDTDGYIDARGHAYYTTTSPRLVKDFLYLARSLGYYACRYDKELPTYSYKEEIRVGRPAFNVYIAGRNRSELVRADKKARRSKEQLTEGGKRVVSVEAVGEIEGRCIQVNNPNSLYLTNDFTVTHNSALITGLALTRHQRSLILRRESTQLRGMIDDIAKTLKTRNGLSTQSGQWRIPSSTALFPDQLIEFGGVPDPGSEEKHQGVPHDFLAFDEVTQLSEYVVDYLSSWNRSTLPNQRCRMVLTSNPPTPSTLSTSRGQATGGGLWLVRRYAPWLDPQYRDPHSLGPAAPGDLRYYVTLDGQEQEWPDPLAFFHPCTPGRGPRTLEHLFPKRDHELVVPRSRTFIPARVADNPYLASTDYESTLQKLPEPLRSAMLYGDFSVSLSDRPKQLIPTEWYRAATARWEATRTLHPHPRTRPMTAIAVDVSRSTGGDKTIIFRRHGDWFDEPIEVPSLQTLNGASVAAKTVEHRRDNCPLVVDANGTGASVFDHLRNNTTIADTSHLIGYVGSLASKRKDRSGLLGFTNKRSEAYWALRDALDPATATQLALPPHDDLMQELLVLTWTEQSGKIQVMPKKEVSKVLGRSPDYSDALVMAWSVYDQESERATAAEDARASRLVDVSASPGRRHNHHGRSGRRPRWSDRRFQHSR